MLRAVSIALLTLVALASCTPSTRLSTGQLGFADAGATAQVRPQVLRVSRRDAAGVVVIAGRFFGGSDGASRVLIGADADGRGGEAAEVRSWRSDRIEIVVPVGTKPGWLVVRVGATSSNAVAFDAQ
jgi:hypothetical protein